MRIEVANRLLGYVFALRSSGPLLRAWGGTTPFFFLFTAEAFEVLEKFLNYISFSVFFIFTNYLIINLLSIVVYKNMTLKNLTW